MARIYKEDIQAAKNLSEILPVEVVTNIFRFNKNQANMLKGKTKVEISSVNNRTNKLLDGGRKSKVVVTPRMVEVAATLNYMGFLKLKLQIFLNAILRLFLSAFRIILAIKPGSE